MSIDAVRAAAAAAATPAAASPRPPREEFAIALERQLQAPRAAVADVRAQVAALRGGGALARALVGVVDVAGLTVEAGPGTMPAWLASELDRRATGDAADPYGWRGLARETGERVIGAGYGALFERQIQQESGFAPEVVFGLRVSSAGAEGIAQLMPEYYPLVDRRDPAAALVAGAQSMREYLEEWDGDVRRALASYNAGLKRVRSLVETHGGGWEAALPQETRDYLQAIAGAAA